MGPTCCTGRYQGVPKERLPASIDGRFGRRLRQERAGGRCTSNDASSVRSMPRELANEV